MLNAILFFRICLIHARPEGTLNLNLSLNSY